MCIIFFHDYKEIHTKKRYTIFTMQPLVLLSPTLTILLPQLRTASHMHVLHSNRMQQQKVGY